MAAYDRSMPTPRIDHHGATLRRLRRYRAEWSLFAGVFVVFGALTTFTLLRSHADVEQQESDRLQVQARVISDNMLQQLDGVDLALLGVREEIGNNAGMPDSLAVTTRRLHALTDAVPSVRAMWVLDANGVVIASDRPDVLARNFGDREYFITLRSHPARDVLFVSRPFEGARGAWIVVLTRTLTDRAGRFAGIVSAALDPDYYQVMMRSVLYAADMQTTLVHGDGVVFLSLPAALPRGAKLSQAGSPFDLHLQSGLPATLLTGRFIDSGEPHLVATRTLLRPARDVEPPLVVEVSRSIDAIFAPWRRQRNALVAFLVALGAASAGALVFTQNRRREFEALDARSRKEREDSTRRVRTITDNLPALISYIDRDCRYRFTNAYYRTFLGFDPDSLIGKRLEDVVGEAAYAEMNPHIVAALSGEPRSFERHNTEGALDVHLLINYIPDFDDTGSVAGMYVMTTDVTATKRAELARAAIERRLRDITDSIPAVILYCDENERCGFINSVAERVFGLDAVRLADYSLREALGEATYALHEPHIQTVLGGKRTSFEGHAEYRKRERFFMTHLLPDIGDDGAVRGFYMVSFSIKALKQAELQRTRSEQRLRAITDNVPALISHFDRNERCDFCNPYCGEVYGLDPQQMIGRTIRELRGVELHSQTSRYIDAVLGGESVAFEIHTVLGGRDRYLQQSYVPDIGSDGSVQGFYSVSFDITDRKRDEHRLAASEKRLRDVTDNLPVLISYIDAEQKVRFLNGTFNTWMGVDVEQVIDHPLAEVLDASTYARSIDHLKRALAGERVEFDLALHTKTGERNLQNVYVPDRSADGAVTGVYTLSTDVTALKRVEQQLSALARFDSLTGLANRHQLDQELAAALARTDRSGLALALLFLDVDHFKAINDTLGHAGGDAVLKEVAARLQRAVRATDTVARFAGDEFVVILESLHGQAEAQAIAAKILSQIGLPFDVIGHRTPVTMSIGVAFHRGGTVSSADLLGHADAGLYRAKAAGRNGYVLIASGTHEGAAPPDTRPEPRALLKPLPQVRPAATDDASMTKEPSDAAVR